MASASSSYRIEIVGSDYYSELFDGLLLGVDSAFRSVGISIATVPIHRVFGAFEIPLAVQRLITERRDSGAHIDAVVTLGVVIKGETAHFDYICSSVYNGLTEVQLKTGVPIAAGILTVYNMQQAIARSQGDGLRDDIGPKKVMKNKGFEAGMAAISAVNMAHTLSEIRPEGGSS